MRSILLLVCLTLPATVQAQFPFGHATPVSGQAPALFAEPLFIGNPAYGYRVRGAPPGGSVIVGISAARQDQIIGGLQAYLDLSSLVITHASTADANGRASFPFPLSSPDDPALTGLQLYAQAAVSDPAIAGSLGTTQGVLLEITLHPMLAYTSWANLLWLIDPVDGTNKTVAGLPPGFTARSAVFGNGGRDLFVAADGGLLVVDTLNPAPQAQILATGNWSSAAWDRVRRRLYALNPFTQTLTVFDGDRASLGFGTVLAQASDGSHSIAIDTAGEVIALVNSQNGSLTRRDPNPASPTYLQTIPTPQPPIVIAFGTFVGGAQVTGDGRVISIPVSSPVPPATTVMHRFDSFLGAWIDHDPVAAGYQPFGAATHPVPLAFGWFPSRDGDAVFLPAFGTIPRIELDLSSPINFVIIPTPVAPLGGGHDYVGLTPSGRFLLRRDSNPFNTPLSLQLVDVATGRGMPLATLPAASGALSGAGISAWR
jgi:hypothetical protein